MSLHRYRSPGVAVGRDPLARVTDVLAPDQVDLWRVALDETPTDVVAWFRSLLSPDEEQRARRFFFDRDRRRFVVGRGVLRVLLSTYLDLEPSEIAFAYGANGKPWVPGAGSVAFNLAHSEGLALYAFTRSEPVGVDLERIRELPDWEAIASSCFPRADRELVRACAPNERQAAFFAAWTRQEARLKAVGTGFGGEDPVNAGMVPLTVCAIEVATGFAAALAIGSEARWASCRCWEDWWLTNLGAWDHAQETSRQALAKGSVAFL